MEVLIVGAGPVGLMLSCQLQRRGVAHRLVETRPRRDYWCKALGVSPRTLEIFDQMGCLDEALNRGLFFTASNTVVQGEVVARVEIARGDDPYGALALGQYDTEEVLEHDLRRHGGRIEWGRTVTGLTERADCVEAVLDNGEKLEARYVVGCDGAHSLVRKTMGVSFEGGRYPMVFVLGDVEMDWPHPHSEVFKIIQFEDGQIRNYLVVVPIPGNPQRYRLSMAAQPDDGSELPELTLESLREYAGPLLPPETKLRNLRWGSFYRISHRLAGSYRKGRLFLAGDAAHIHPPIGGLGMNTGLQDAFNLGWKLATGREELLETYHPERHQVGQDVVALTASRMDDATQGKERDEAAEERANTQLFVHYRGGPLAFGAVPPDHRGAHPGDRLDFVDGLERKGIARRARCIDLMRDQLFHLFCYGGRYPRLRLGDQVQCWAIVAPGETPDLGEEVPVLTDALGQARQAWGDGPGAILVRPDGHVAWRGSEPDGELDRLLDLLGLQSVKLIPG